MRLSGSVACACLCASYPAGSKILFPIMFFAFFWVPWIEEESGELYSPTEPAVRREKGETGTTNSIARRMSLSAFPGIP